jgi:hypothetical protein
MKVKGFVRSRMRESRTYGSVRGGYRKVSVYSIMELSYKAIFRIAMALYVYEIRKFVLNGTLQTMKM